MLYTKRDNQRGFTYIGLLFLVAAVGILLWKAGEYWSFAQQREKERELLFAGNQFRQAIASFYNKSPGSVKKYPETLENLLEDKRYLTVQRHLRKIFVDPISNSREWGIVPAPSGGILGVYSLSEKHPIKMRRFSASNASFKDATKYSDWKFVYLPPAEKVNQAAEINNPQAND